MSEQEQPMSMKPIIFSTQMVQAILDGHKTMTRRVIKDGDLINAFDIDVDGSAIGWRDAFGDFYKPEEAAPYQVGDILWVRETWQYAYNLDANEQVIEETGRYIFVADGDPGFTHWLDSKSGELIDHVKWSPSIHMPKKAARIFLRVTDVRVERVQGISPQDAHKEGIDFRPFNGDYPHYKDWLIKDFKELWDSTISKKDMPLYGWDANPWVWVYTFERVDKPRGGENA